MSYATLRMDAHPWNQKGVALSQIAGVRDTFLHCTRIRGVLHKGKLFWDADLFSFAKLNIRFALLKDAESDVRSNFPYTKEKQQDAMKF